MNEQKTNRERSHVNGAARIHILINLSIIHAKLTIKGNAQNKQAINHNIKAYALNATMAPKRIANRARIK